MSPGRLEAFSDGVIAIIITIMVLELRPPAGGDWAALLEIWPKFLAYVLSFVYLGIYWNNHHHLLHLVERISGGIMWANLHLLFWLSLVPFTTAWLGARPGTPSAALYGLSLLLPGVAYTLLVRAIVRDQLRRSGGRHSALRDAVGGDAKGYASLALYLAGIGLAFVSPITSYAIFAGVAAIWLVPDRRISRRLED
jgi:uncharacterized membrane protein